VRKTIEIKELIETINRRNQQSTCDPKMREGWNCILESILYNSDVYAGYNYYPSNQLGENIEPGMAWENIKTGEKVYTRPDEKDKDQYKNIFPDETRRFYYSHYLLAK